MNAAKKMEIGNRLFGYGLAVKMTSVALFASTFNWFFLLTTTLGFVSVIAGLILREISKETNKYNMYYGVRH